MSTLTAEQVLHAHQWRYAVKKFDATRVIPAATWEALEKTLVLSPSSFGLQPWKFIVITSKDLREALVPHSWGQKQVSECSHFVVFTAKNEVGPDDSTALIQATSAVRGVPEQALAGYKQVIDGFLANAKAGSWLDPWTAKQTYIALGNLMTTAALLGVDTCPMEGIDAAKFDEILGLKGTGYRTIVGCAVGYRAADDKYAAAAKVRYPASQLIEHR